MKKSTAFYLVIISIAMFLVALFIPVMTILVILWSLLLIAFFSILFYWIGKALTEWIEWLIWRIKLQMKRCKEKRRKRRNSSKFDGGYLDSLIKKSKGNWKDIDADEWVNDLRGKS